LSVGTEKKKRFCLSVIVTTYGRIEKTLREQLYVNGFGCKERERERNEDAKPRTKIKENKKLLGEKGRGDGTVPTVH
jgi:hypothetical protein